MGARLACFVAIACVSLSVASCRGAGPPSILLIVVDTLRADAVSAYGGVSGTTPEIDELARGGLLYRHAYAPAPWTLPSHATIFTGLRVDQHRVAMPGRHRLPEDALTIAEQLGDAGYETAAFSENGGVNDAFGMLQGFDHKEVSFVQPISGRYLHIETVSEFERWLASRDESRPFFAFVNLFDPHQPYRVRDENPFVAPGTPQEQVKSRSGQPNRMICSGLADRKQMSVQHGLYLGDVHSADSKLGQIHRAAREGAASGGLVTVVTSDHGEYFGEDDLMGHEFGLHAAVLNVPLVVHGLRGVEPTVVEETVGLVDLAPSILEWAGVETSGELPGRPLPRRSTGTRDDRVVFSAFSDQRRWFPGAWQEHVPLAGKGRGPWRESCGESDKVYGGMASMIRYPFKFRWFERYPPELYDLRWDPAEMSDQAEFQPEVVERFSRAISPYLRAAGLEGGHATDGEEISEEALRTLKALGYIE